jgi:hypothetical protein
MRLFVIGQRNDLTSMLFMAAVRSGRWISGEERDGGQKGRNAAAAGEALAPDSSQAFG